MEAGCIDRYFPGLDPDAKDRFDQLAGLYKFWNAKINVISRKDIPNLCINHVLHSLSLARVIPFSRSERVLDVGTGGGFPGIPLAIMFPEVHFTLNDSIGKKIRVAENIARELGLANISTAHKRAEDIKDRFHYVISRAVCSFPELVRISAGRLLTNSSTLPVHGIYSLKGGDLQEELEILRDKVTISEISAFFKEDFFETKKIVFLPAVKLKEV